MGTCMNTHATFLRLLSIGLLFAAKDAGATTLTEAQVTNIVTRSYACVAMNKVNTKMKLDFFDQKENRGEPVGEKPFAPKVLPMSAE